MKTRHIPIIFIIILLLVACSTELPTPLLPTTTPPVMTDTSVPATATIIPSLLPSETPEPTTQTPTETVSPSPTEIMTPTPVIIVDTTNFVGWIPNVENSNGNNAINAIKINPDEGYIQMDYDVGKDGYVVMTHSLDPGLLSGSEGIRFLYKGVGAPNSIEFKLLMKYPGFSGDTTFGKLYNRATETGSKWIEVAVPFHVLECWWPDENCADHGEVFDTTRILRLDLVVSNKAGDEPGSGWVIFKDVSVMQP